MSDPFVVKVQKSLVSTAGPQILIYDSSRVVQHQMPLTKKLDNEIPSVKEFYWATLSEAGVIELQGRPIDDVGVRGESPEEQFELYDYKTMNGEGES